MATPNQPNQPQNTGPGSSQAQSQARDQLQSLKEFLKLQGDYKDILKDSIKDLQATLKSYDKMEAKLASINKSSLNIKQIESQIKDIVEDQSINTKKKADLEAKLSTAQKNAASNYTKSLDKRSEIEKNLLKAQSEGNDHLVKRYEQALEAVQNRINGQESILNVEQLAYAQALKTQELNSEILKKTEEQLEKEKELRKNVGYTGVAFKLFADKLGIGEAYYEEMVEKARKLNAEGKKFTFFDKLKLLGSAATGGAMEAITDPLTAIPLAGAAIGGLAKGLKAAFDYIVGIQDQTVKFARAMNLSTGEARQMKMEFASLSVSSGDLFINSQKMVESQMEMVDALGVTNRLNNEQLATNIKLKDITGLDLEARKGIIEASTITGQTSENITKSVLAQVAGLKQATGISFQNQKILKEASNLGGYLGLSFAKYPAQLTKSLLTVKAMGMELKQVDSLADSFLDFESSISKEFEAQLLTGKDINLNKAREAFLNNDLATAAAEITNQVGSSNDFLKMNRIQAESLAQAFGMNRDQLGDMLKQQELLSKLGAKDTDNAREQLRLGLAKYKNQQALSAAIGEEAYQNLVNASLQEKIAAFIEKIKQSISDFVESSGIIDKIEGFFEYLSKPENIKAIITQIRDFFASAVDAVLGITNGIINAIDFITFGFGIDEEFERKFEAFSAGAGDRIRSLGGDFGSTAGTTTDKSIKKESGTTTTTNAESGRMAFPPAPQGNTTAFYLSSDINATLKNGLQAPSAEYGKIHPKPTK